MKRTAATVLALLATLVAASGPAVARPAPSPRHDWLFAHDAASVLMQETDPSAADPFLHHKFKRHGGVGRREVRVFERQMRPATAWYAHPRVRLGVGEKTVYTSRYSLPCLPEVKPIQVELQLRHRLPGRPWGRWTTYVALTRGQLDCSTG